MADKICSVVIVNWNGGTALKKCLESLQKYEDTSKLQIIVSDNNSTDGSVEMLRSNFPGVKVLENGANIGFAAGNNRAFGIADGKYVLILNPDMEFIETGLVKLIVHMEENPEVGAAGCTILNDDGSFMKQCKRGYPDPLSAFFKASGLIDLFPKNRRVGKYFQTHLPQNEEANVDAVSGSFILARKSVIEEVGGFGEEYFLFVEDVDFCLKVRSAGHRVMYLPMMKILHHGGACMDKQKRRKLFYHYHMTRSHIILYAKDRLKKGGGLMYHVAFALIAARYAILSVIYFNLELASHLAEFTSIHFGKIEPIKPNQ